MSDLDRIRWRCRRGLLELDLVLGGFVRENLESLGAAELEAFSRLLDADDNELWDWVSGRAEAHDPTLTGMVARLRAVRCTA
jgi:succinate dehydrogenase flavin-adding protein (antitoxin of CptAB toxin-antitoxin module)